MTKKKQRRVVKKSTTGGVTDTAIVTWFREFVGLKAQLDQIGSRQGEIKDRLKEAVEARGYEDSEGHVWYDLPEEVEGYTRLKREKRIREKFDEEAALALVKKKGLEKKCIKMVPQLDHDALAGAVYAGDITEKEFQALIERTESYAFVPRAK